jgi:hypothetical protein
MANRWTDVRLARFAPGGSQYYDPAQATDPAVNGLETPANQHFFKRNQQLQT